MRTKNVVIEAYNENRTAQFNAIRSEIEKALGCLALRIEHVGSTSVEGLAAKPIIDLDVVVEDENVLPDVIEALGEIGYRHEGNLGIPGREAFDYDGKEHLQKHHLYVCPQNSAELKRHLAFRDYLRTHSEAVAEYSRLKREAAARYPHDIDGYMAYKAPFIERIYREIGLIGSDSAK